jgi:hypothetical protein
MNECLYSFPLFYFHSPNQNARTRTRAAPKVLEASQAAVAAAQQRSAAGLQSVADRLAHVEKGLGDYQV